MPVGYDPIGAFDPSAPLLPEALDAANAMKASLPVVSGKFTRLYLHWEVEPFGCVDGAYNGVVDLEGGKWVLRLSHDLRLQFAPNTEAAHTWHRNTGAIGLAIAGMDGATMTDFGPDGVQMHELEYLCAFAAVCCVTYGIDSAGTVAAPGSDHDANDGGNVNTTGEHNILTHAECAVLDLYPSERWDLGCLRPLRWGIALTPEMRSQSGDALRERIHRYAQVLDRK